MDSNTDEPGKSSKKGSSKEEPVKKGSSKGSAKAESTRKGSSKGEPGNNSTIETVNGSSQEEPIKKGSKKGSSKEEPVKKGSSKGEPVKKGSAKEEPVKKGSSKGESVKKGSSKEEPVKKGSKKGSAKEEPAKKGSDKKGSDKKGSDKKGSDKKGSSKEEPVKKGSKKGSSKEPVKKGSDKKGSDKKGSSKEEPVKKGSAKGSSKEEPVKKGSKKGSTKKGSDKAESPEKASEENSSAQPEQSKKRSRKADPDGEGKEASRTPRKRPVVEWKEGERKSERTPKQSTIFKPEEPKDETGITVPKGKGTPIGEIANCSTALRTYQNTDPFLGKLHRLMFGPGGKKKDFKQNIRLFKGYALGEDRAKLLKKVTQSKLEMEDLKPICHVLDIRQSGTRDELVELVVDFLFEPKASGKAYQKERAGTKRKSSPSGNKASGNKAVSGYMMFFKAKRASVVAKHPELKFGEVSKLLGKKWKKLDEAEQAEWVEKGRTEGASGKEKEKKKSSKKKKSKKEQSSSEEEESSEEEDEEEKLSVAIRAKIHQILEGGSDTLTIRQIKEQLKVDFAPEVESNAAEIKAFVHKCVEKQMKQ